MFDLSRSVGESSLTPDLKGSQVRRTSPDLVGKCPDLDRGWKRYKPSSKEAYIPSPPSIVWSVVLCHEEMVLGEQTISPTRSPHAKRHVCQTSRPWAGLTGPVKVYTIEFLHLPSTTVGSERECTGGESTDLCARVYARAW